VVSFEGKEFVQVEALEIASDVCDGSQPVCLMVPSDAYHYSVTIGKLPAEFA